MSTTTPDMPDTPHLSEMEKRLLNAFQDDFPLVPNPYAAAARELGIEEAEIMDILESLRERGILDRIGPLFRPHRVGWSTLAAMNVPPERLERVADIISANSRVNHNYERDHGFNLWFVVTAPDKETVEEVLGQITDETGIVPLSLPLEEAYHINLGFTLP